MKTNLNKKSLTLLGLTAITTLSYGDDNKLGTYSMMIVSKYFEDIKDYVNSKQACKEWGDNSLKFHYNPIPLDSEPITIDVKGKKVTVYVWDLFKNIKTAYIYGSESSDFLSELESKLPESVETIHCCKRVSWEQWKAIPKKLKKMSEVWFINKQFDKINVSELNEVYDKQKVRKFVYTAIDYRTWIELPQEWINKLSFKDITFSELDLKKELGNERKPLADLLEFEVPFGVTRIGDKCFKDCKNLTTITLLDGLTSIGDDCFRDCEALTTIKLPEGLTSIGNDCFFDCNLKGITIPSSVKSIGYDCFLGSNNLNSIKLPKRFEDQLKELKINPKKTTVSYIEDAQVTATGNESENAAPNDNAEDNPTDENA